MVCVFVLKYGWQEFACSIYFKLYLSIQRSQSQGAPERRVMGWFIKMEFDEKLKSGQKIIVVYVVGIFFLKKTGRNLHVLFQTPFISHRSKGQCAAKSQSHGTLGHVPDHPQTEDDVVDVWQRLRRGQPEG